MVELTLLNGEKISIDPKRVKYCWPRRDPDEIKKRGMFSEPPALPGGTMLVVMNEPYNGMGEYVSVCESYNDVCERLK